jgi:rRNA maturation endonuclease Nob1
MSVRAVLAQLLPGDEPEVVVECRHCGTKLPPDADQCPDCGSDEIGHHRISE